MKPELLFDRDARPKPAFQEVVRLARSASEREDRGGTRVVAYAPASAS